MKNILKYLTIAGVLILFLPFFQMCSDKQTFKVAEKNAITTQKDTEKEAKAVINKKTDNSVLNGYEMGFFIFQTEKTFANTIKNIFKDWGSFAFVFFFLMVINTYLTALFAFLNKIRSVRILSIINITLLISSYIILSFSWLEDFSQIKFGSYLFLLNLTAIIYFTFKLNKTQNNNTIYEQN